MPKREIGRIYRVIDPYEDEISTFQQTGVPIRGLPLDPPTLSYIPLNIPVIYVGDGTQELASAKDTFAAIFTGGRKCFILNDYLSEEPVL